MGRRRIDLYRREKPRERRGGHWRDLPLSTFVQVFLGLSAIMAALAGLLWFTGIMDFTAERGWLRLTPGALELTRRSPTLCGYVFLFLPDELENTRLCIGLNLAPFTVLPLIVLFMTFRRLFAGLTDGRG